MQKREDLQNQNRFSETENTILLYFEKPKRQLFVTSYALKKRKRYQIWAGTMGVFAPLFSVLIQNKFFKR